MSDARGTRLQIGMRAVVRYRISDGDHTLTDAVGEILEITDETVRIATKRGEVAISTAAITVAKQVPPAPPRRAPRQR